MSQSKAAGSAYPQLYFMERAFNRSGIVCGGAIVYHWQKDNTGVHPEKDPWIGAQDAQTHRCWQLEDALWAG